MDGRALAARDFVFPFNLWLDSENKTLTVSKRNWFIVGIDTKSFNFGQIRNVFVDEHLFTSIVNDSRLRGENRMPLV